MKKRLLAVFACLCMLLTLLPAAVFAEEKEIAPGETIEYVFDPNNRGYFFEDAWFSLKSGVHVDSLSVDGVPLENGVDYEADSYGVLSLTNAYLSKIPLGDSVEVKVPDCYTVTIKSDPAEMVTAYCEELDAQGDTIYVPTDAGTITLEPVPLQDWYGFVAWRQDGQPDSSEPKLQLTVDQDMTVTAVGRMLNLGLDANPENLDFGSAAVGYTQPQGRMLTITNNGEMPLELTGEELQYYEVVPVEGELTVSVGGSVIIMVRPKQGLPVGEYSETLQIEGRIPPEGPRALSDEVEPLRNDEPEPIALNLPLSFTVYQPCTVTFDANGHGTAPAALEGVVPGTVVQEPAALTAEGWTFLGWYREPTGENHWNFAVDLVEGDMTLYAVWMAQPVVTPEPTPEPTQQPTPAPTEAPADEQPAAEQPAAEQPATVTPVPTAAAQPAASQAPQTGDSTLLVWLGLLGAAGCGLAALERLRKRG